MSRLRAVLFILVSFLSLTAVEPVCAQTQATAPVVANANKLIAVVPFEYTQNQIVVYLSVAASPEKLRFVVDSGASDCVLDSEVAARLKLRQRDIKFLGLPVRLKLRARGYGNTTVPVKSVDGFQATLWTKDGTAPLLALPTLRCNSLPLAFLGTKEEPIHGLIGHDFFKHYAVELDYEAKTMRLYEPKTFTYPGAGTVLPIKFSNRVPLISVTAMQNNRPTLLRKIILDTGNAGSIHLNRPVVVWEKLAEGIPTMTIASQGIGGAEPGSYGRLQSLTMGGYTVPAPLTIFSAATKGDGGASKERDGGVGNGIWSRFKVTLDFLHERVYLEPNARLNEVMKSGWFVCGWTTVLDKPAGGHRITAITPGTAAAQAGLQVGDTLTAVDTDSFLTHAPIFQNTAPHRLTFLRNGATITIDFRAQPL